MKERRRRRRRETPRDFVWLGSTRLGFVACLRKRLRPERLEESIHPFTKPLLSSFPPGHFELQGLASLSEISSSFRHFGCGHLTLFLRRLVLIYVRRGLRMRFFDLQFFIRMLLLAGILILFVFKLFTFGFVQLSL